MKKILTTIAIVAMAAVTNAAATNWQLTCGNLKGADGNAFAGKFELFATGGDLATDLLVLTKDPSNATYNKFNIEVTTGLTVGESYNFYYVLTDGSKQLKSANSAMAYTALETGAPLINLGNQATYTSNTSNWQAIPEPTSGLLLLLGVAGLALKRRRA